MIGRIIEINSADAYVSFDDGTTKNIPLCYLPADIQEGSSVNVHPSHEDVNKHTLSNSHLNNNIF